MSEKMLEVTHLHTQFSTDEGTVHAVEDVNFFLNKGETLGIVGESGSGKSVTSLSVMRLVTGKITEGSILFNGKDLLKLSETEMEHIRGNEITMIFQDPMTSLDPVYTIGFQLREVLRRHNKRMSRAEADRIAVDMLRRVGIANPDSRMSDYPHQLSGGMRQRVIIAMGLCCQPKLLIADEPTTALDVTIQAQILDLMRELKRNSDMSIMLITHDLGVVAEMCDRVVVMYCGQVVESGTVREIFKNPRHKYTQGLLASIPRVEETSERLKAIEGNVPNALMFPSGCRFHPRCPYADEICRTQAPEPVEVCPGHFASCHYYMTSEEAAQDA